MNAWTVNVAILLLLVFELTISVDSFLIGKRTTSGCFGSTTPTVSPSLVVLLAQKVGIVTRSYRVVVYG